MGVDMSEWKHLEECILLGFPGSDHYIRLLNYCILLGNFFIYCNKISENNTLDFYAYLVQLKQKLQMEMKACPNADYTHVINDFLIEM